MLKQEKRTQDNSHRRAYTEIPVRYRMENQVFCPARTLDVSVRGMRLEVSEKPRQGQDMAVTLKTTEAASILLNAKVKWFSPSWKPGCYEVGVEFHNPGRSEALQLRRQLSGLN